MLIDNLSGSSSVASSLLRAFHAMENLELPNVIVHILTGTSRGWHLFLRQLPRHLRYRLHSVVSIVLPVEGDILSV